MASATVVTLPQMVDLALNSPEVGIVNFTVLHSLLHVIVKQLDLVDTNVEFRGSDSERLQSYIANAKPGPLLTLTEYTVGEEGSEKDEKKKVKKGIRGAVVEKGKTDERQTEKEGPGHSESQNKVIVVESSKDIAGGPTVVVTKHHFDKLEDDVKKLRKKVKELAELPANSALLEVLRGENPDKTPVIEMFQILNLSKRLDAAEVGMQKLASLMEDLAKRGSVISAEDVEAFSEKAKQVRSSFEDTAPAPTASTLAIEKRLEKLEKVVFEGPFDKKRSDTDASDSDKAQAEAKSSPTNKPSPTDKTSPTQSDKLSPDKKTSQKPSAQSKPSKPHSDSDDGGVDGDENVGMATSSSVAALQQDLAVLKKTVNAMVDDMDGIKKLLSNNTEGENLPPELRLNQLENKLIDCQDQLTSLDHMFCRQVEILQKRIVDLERDAGEIVEKVNLGLTNAETSQPEGQSVGELYNKLLQTQDVISTVGETCQKLLEDREEKNHTLEIMLEQIELLKTVKADREDLEDALADKADACMVNRKVSVEQFDAACGDMNKAIEDSLGKLAQQEELWAQALEDIQKEIGNKMDKVELVPLRDYINKKLKGLQEKFKSLTALRKENEAAGTKSKIMRNVNCISCDKDVVMRKEIDSSLFPKAYALPPTRNMAPYLAYELDQLRKQQKHIPPKKDLNMFENALKTAKSPKGPDHLCNRYCGGSHTVTTPQQRVTRLGHFLEQWGPEIAPANDTMIRGSDGHMYKGRDDKVAFAIADTMPPATIPEEVPASPKNVFPVNQSPGSLSQAKGEGEPSQNVKKTSLRSPKNENETKPTPNSLATTSEAPPVAEGEPEPQRKSRASEDRRRSITKTRKRSKGSVKYSTRSSGDIRATEIPESRLIEEPAADVETEQYADPEA